MKRSKFAIPHTAWMAFFILAPIVLIFYYAFTDENMVFTLDNIVKAFSSTSMLIFGRSVLMAALTTVICILIGYPCAYLLSKLKAKNALIITVLFMLPMWMNFLLRTYAWRVLLDSNGFINQFITLLGFEPVQFLYNDGAVLFGLVYDYLPFMILPIYSVFMKMDLSCIDAAEDLGANRMQTFMRVTLPLSRPGIISGCIMVFMPSMTTFVISVLLGGSKTLYYGDLIEYQFLQFSDWHTGSALAIVLMILMILSMLLFTRNDKKGQGVTLL